MIDSKQLALRFSTEIIDFTLRIYRYKIDNTATKLNSELFHRIVDDI